MQEQYDSRDDVTRCCDECLSYGMHETTCSQNPNGPLTFDGTKPTHNCSCGKECDCMAATKTECYNCWDCQ